MLFWDFLKQVKGHNKKLFVFIVLICLIYVENFVVEISNLNYIQATPFTGYAMYSAKMDTSTTYPIFSVTINHRKKNANFWHLTQQNKQILQQALTYYSYYKSFNYRDPKHSLIEERLNTNPINPTNDTTAFKMWYLRYLTVTLNEKVNCYKADILQLTYDKNGNQSISDTLRIFEYQWNK